MTSDGSDPRPTPSRSFRRDTSAWPPRPTTDFSTLDAAIEDADAVGFVAVGDRFDAGLRYLTRFGGPECEYAFVRTHGESVLCAPRGFVGRATGQFDGRVATEKIGDPPGERAATVLDDANGDANSPSSTSSGPTDGPSRPTDSPPRVLVPPTIPHDAAVYLERAGYELQSTTAVADARATKTDAEVDAIRAVQRAATAGVRRAERLLAASEVGDETDLHLDGTALTPGRLRRAVDAELATHGVTDAGNTAVSAGPTAAGGVAGGLTGITSAGSDGRDHEPIRANDPVAVQVVPRGPHGYHGSLARTFVADSDGGWDRRAYVAVESALDAALAAIEPAVVASTVGLEADAELAAFGFDPTAEADSDGDSTDPGHGVGLSRREPPSLRADTELEPGTVVAVAPRVTDPEVGMVALSQLVAVTSEGYERLGDGARPLTPRE